MAGHSKWAPCRLRSLSIVNYPLPFLDERLSEDVGERLDNDRLGGDEEDNHAAALKEARGSNEISVGERRIGTLQEEAGGIGFFYAVIFPYADLLTING